MKTLRTVLLSTAVFFATNLYTMEQIQDPSDTVMSATQKAEISTKLQAIYDILQSAVKPFPTTSYAPSDISAFIATANNPTDEGWLYASSQLLDSSELEYKKLAYRNFAKFAREALAKIENKSAQNIARSIIELCHSPEYLELIQTLSEIITAQKKYADFIKGGALENSQFSEQYLDKYEDHEKTLKKELDAYLRLASIAKNPQHPDVLDATFDILNHRHDSLQAQMKMITDEDTISAASDPAHPDWLLASFQLLYSAEIDHKSLACKNIKKFAQDALRAVPADHPSYEDIQKMAIAEML